MKGLDLARFYWERASVSDKQSAAYHVRAMDEALRSVGKNRSDIGVTDDNVQNALVEGGLATARFYWERASVSDKQSAAYHVRAMDEALRSVGKNRSDIGVTEEQV